jgi:glutathione synthase/RimK-type ligase-like ATP-grasp enzyme
MYVKLAKAGVSIPKTIAGTKRAISRAQRYLEEFTFPIVLKRADADRGIDNYKVDSTAQLEQLLNDHDPMSLWLVQEFVPNEGFYLLSYYSNTAAFCIYRSLEVRPDGNALKSHMYKPKGGKNATLVPIDEVPAQLKTVSLSAMEAMNRQIGSVDCIYDAKSSRVYVLEVNYNPQLVTVATFKTERQQALLDYLPHLGE